MVKKIVNFLNVFALIVLSGCIQPQDIPVHPVEEPLPPIPQPLRADAQWRSMALRSEAEANSGASGGESYQIMHRMVRSYYHPERAYAMEDVAGPWRSDDGGTTWTKPQSKGLYVPYGQTIEVDPVNQDKVLAIGYYPYDPKLDQMAGIYLSADGARTFNLVKAYDDPDAEYTDGGDNSRIGFQWDRHRFNNVNLVYDLTSTNGGTQEAQVWYAAFHGAALFRSEDGGINWSQVCSLEDKESIFQIALHPTNNQIIYLCTSEGLFKSTNRGSTFTEVGDLPLAPTPSGMVLYKNHVVPSLAFNPENPEELLVTLNCLARFGANGKPTLWGTGLYKSTDGGAHFTQIVLTADTFEGVFNENKVSDFNSAIYVYRHPVDKDTIVISGSVQGFVTNNGGAKWFRTPPAVVFPGLGRDTSSGRKGMGNAILAFNPQNNKDFLFHWSAAFWRTLDGGKSTIETSTGFTGMAWGFGWSVAAFDPFNAKRMAFFNCDVGSKITMNGGNWFENWGFGYTSDGKTRVTALGQGFNAGDFQPLRGSQVIVAATGEYSKNVLVRSVDNGKSWSLVNGAIKNYYFVGFHPKDPNLVFSHDMVSYDAGLTWSVIPFPAKYAFQSGTQWVTPVVAAIHKGNPDIVYAIGDYNRGILRSMDRGKTWSLYHSFGIKISGPDGSVAFAVDPADPDRIYALDSPTGNIMTYDGKSAQLLDIMGLIPGNLPGNHVSSIVTDPNYPGTVYAGTHYPGLSCIFKSTDYGKTWKDVTGTLPMVGMTSSKLKVNPHTSALMRGGPYGTWVMD